MAIMNTTGDSPYAWYTSTASPPPEYYYQPYTVDYTHYSNDNDQIFIDDRVERWSIPIKKIEDMLKDALFEAMNQKSEEEMFADEIQDELEGIIEDIENM